MTLSEYHPEASNGNGYHPLEDLPEQLELPMSAEPEMTPARMAALTGLNLPKENRAIETAADIAGDRQPTSEEDPLEVRTERSLPNNPIAKMGLVGAGTFGAVAIAGLFLTATFEGGKKNQPAQAPAQPADPLVQQTFPDKAGSANGQVLTDLALSQQQQELTALNEKGKKLATPASTVTPRRVPARSLAPQRPQPQRISYAAPLPQRLNYSTARPGNYSLRPSGPRITTTPMRSAPVAPAPAPRVAPASQDPMSAWLAAAQIGSYGGNSVAAPADNAVTPAATPVAMPAPVGQPVIAGNSLANQPFLTPATYTSGNQQGYQPVATTPLSSTYEEVALLADQPLKSIDPGAKAKATLVTPLVLDQGLLQNAAGEQQILELKDPIKSADGSVVLPAGTQLVAQVSGFSNSGVVDLSVVAAMTPTETQAMQLPLPQGALQVYSSRGTPLVAQRMGGDSGGGILNEFKQFALGAARQAAELYTRSDSTVISNGDNLVVRNRNQQPNLLAGIVQGGTDALFNGLERRQQAEAAALAQQANVLGLKNGTEVEILVSRPLMLPAMGDLPTTILAEEEQFLQSPFEFAQDSPFAPAASEPLMPEAVELMNIEGFKIPVEYTLNSGAGSPQSIN